MLETVAEPMARYPLAFGHALTAADLAVHGAVEVALVGSPGAPDFRSLARVASDVYVPGLVLAGGEPASGAGLALMEGRVALDGRATAYVCRGYVCDKPVTSEEELREQLVANPRSTTP